MILSSSFKVIPYKLLHNWIPTNYVELDEIKSFYSMELLENHIEEESSVISPNSLKNSNDIRLGGVDRKGYHISENTIANRKAMLKKVKVNSIIYNPFRINQGSIGIRRAEHLPKYVTGAYGVFSCKETLLPEYLILVLKSKPYISQISYMMSNNARPRLNFNALQALHVPVPNINIQKQIIASFNSKMNKIDKLRALIDDSKNKIENLILEFLDLDSSDFTGHQEAFSVIKYRDLRIWSVPQLRKIMNAENIFYTKKFPLVKLSELVECNPSFRYSPSTIEVPYVPLKSIEGETGEISYEHTISWKQSRNYVKFREGDLLLPKISPSLENNKITMAQQMDHEVALGSRDLYVLRVISDETVIPIYLLYLFRSQQFRNIIQLFYHGSTGGYKRLSKELLLNIKIPLPSIKVQLELLDKLTKIQKRIKELLLEIKKIYRIAVNEFDRELYT
nr:restriction endonuclease subunit S [Priestia megaterium]